MRAAIRLLYDHLLLTLVIGISCSYFFHDWKLLVLALLTGWMIDADHLVDFFYYLWRRRAALSTGSGSGQLAQPPLVIDDRVSLKTFTSGCYFRSNGKIIVPLHSWELAVLWAVCWIAVDNVAIAVAGALPWLAHLMQDQIANRIIPFGYFLSYRIYHQFSRAGFCRK